MTNVTRAEWMAIIGLLLSIASASFTVGVVWSNVQDQEIRLTKQEVKMDTLIPKLERIEVGVQFLAERAREDRERGK